MTMAVQSSLLPRRTASFTILTAANSHRRPRVSWCVVVVVVVVCIVMLGGVRGDVLVVCMVMLGGDGGVRGDA